VSIVAPVNVEGNAELVRMIDALIPPNTNERTRLIVGNGRNQSITDRIK
jgi:hypothetical protein